jgi:glycosyltransferase involved in cell wall biosynthesis
VKVLVLTAAYPSPSEPERAVFIENLTLALAERLPGSVTAVVAPRVRREDPPREDRRGIAVRRFAYPGGGRRLKEIERPSPWLLGAYAASGLAATLGEARRLGADCLLAHWVLPAGPIAAAAAKLLDLPLVVVAHGSDINLHARSSRVRGLAARWCLARARRVLAVSEDLRRLLTAELGVPEGRLSLLRMGVDAALFRRRRSPDEARRALDLDPGLPVLLFVGDLTAAKGVADLIQAWRLLAARGVAAQLCLVGGGPLAGVAAEAAANGAGRRLRLPGRRPQAELELWYRAADLFVLPSHAEGAPVSIMEALSAGVPVVASRTGGIPELVEDGRTGKLVPPGAPEALAAALGGLLAERESLAALRRGAESLPPDAFAVEGRARELAAILREAVDA